LSLSYSRSVFPIFPLSPLPAGRQVFPSVSHSFLCVLRVPRLLPTSGRAGRCG
jgi:hypothetical protein